MKSRLPFAVLLAAGLAAFASPVTAQLVRIPRTSVAIAPPPGFTISREFVGLENAATGSAIRISEFPPEAHSELMAAFASPKRASDRFASQGVRITRIEQLAVGATTVPFATGGQQVNGREIVKYMAVLGGAPAGTRTVWIVFDVGDPRAFRRSDVETALRSIAIARPPTQPTIADRVARLPFRFLAVAPFQAATVNTSSVLLTISGKAQTESNEPQVVIERDLSLETPDQAPQLNDKLMRSVFGFEDAQRAEQRPEEFAGGRGHYLQAAAGDLSVFAYLRVLPNGEYIRLVARGDTDRLEELRDAVAEIAASVTLPD